MIAILEVGGRGDDLEARVLEQLDQRRARVEDQVLRELVAHPSVPGDRAEQALRVGRDEDENSSGPKELAERRERVMRIGEMLEDVKESHGFERGTRVHKMGEARAIDLEAAGSGGANGFVAEIDSDVLELARGALAEKAVSGSDLEDPRVRGEVFSQDGQPALVGAARRGRELPRRVSMLGVP